MKRSLRIALISDVYPPLKTSAAVQMRDLAQEFAILGHKAVVIVPSPAAAAPWTLTTVEGVDVLRVAAPQSRVHQHVRRAIMELLLPFAMLRNFRKSPLREMQWDLIVWYSPPIFFGPLVLALGFSRRTLRYLILRDIFPEWAVDLGILNRGPAYWLLKSIAAFQYFVADVIGVQTESNKVYLPKWTSSQNRRVEVLHNWLATGPNIGCSISVSETALAGRKIFVYIGNMGLAQGMDILLDLAESLRGRQDIGFLFVGRGSEYQRLVSESASRGLGNVLFHDEIDSTEIPGLLAQCDVGLLSLHPAHKTHNIPGKFVSYTHYGLPVLARVNAGTDLFDIIEKESVGRAYFGDSVEELKRLAEDLADHDELRQEMSERGKRFGNSMFSTRSAAEQILAAVDRAGD